ncbi:MAG TPA: glycine cleavage T C-terminal barrel domain-containing protein [Candidatus Acidoferrales bacterium]|nr:glycine cleavage T C-terminal barrel domain-containing protein [Candidatus Acidoferrales bacterium]
MDTPLQSKHAALRAKFGSYFGVSLPAEFDGMAGEWRRARESAALFDTNYHAVFTLAGPDRARYLNAVTSGDIRALTSGRGTPGLLLNSQGHILAELDTFAEEERFLLLSHAMAAGRTYETLDKFIIMDDCTLADAADEWATCALEGPRAGEALAAVCAVPLDALPLFGLQETEMAGATCRVLRRAHFGQPGVEILAPRPAIGAVWDVLEAAVRSAGGGPAGWEAINALRIEAGVRWFGSDFDDTVIPHEAGLDETHISYTKGCYTGQEIVERVRSRGKLNRWLVRLEFSGEAPGAGAKLEAGGKSWGQVTSSAYSPGANAYIGFGYLRREQSAVGTELTHGGGAARVTESPAEPPKNYFHPAKCG